MVTVLFAGSERQRRAAVEQERPDRLVGQAGDNELAVGGPVIDEEVEPGLAAGEFLLRAAAPGQFLERAGLGAVDGFAG